MKHIHEYKARRPNATVLVCACGRFQNVISKDNPAIVEVSTHTPTPWKLDGTMVYDTEGHYVAKVSVEEGTANAAYIVRAVNAHEELLRALKHLAARMPNSEKENEWINDIIAKAEGR